jgi:hypothetical protein
MHESKTFYHAHFLGVENMLITEEKAKEFICNLNTVFIDRLNESLLPESFIGKQETLVDTLEIIDKIAPDLVEEVKWCIKSSLSETVESFVLKYLESHGFIIQQEDIPYAECHVSITKNSVKLRIKTVIEFEISFTVSELRDVTKVKEALMSLIDQVNRAIESNQLMLV